MILKAEPGTLVTQVRVLIRKGPLTGGKVPGSPEGLRLPRNPGPSPPPAWSEAGRWLGRLSATCRACDPDQSRLLTCEVPTCPTLTSLVGRRGNETMEHCGIFPDVPGEKELPGPAATSGPRGRGAKRGGRRCPRGSLSEVKTKGAAAGGRAAEGRDAGALLPGHGSARLSCCLRQERTERALTARRRRAPARPAARPLRLGGWEAPS